MNHTTCFDVSLPRVETAHVMIALHPTVHDSRVTLLLNAFFCDSRIHPVREPPLLWTDFPPFHLATCVIHYRLLECRIEVSVVEEDIRVVEPAIEMPLDRFYGLEYTIQFLIPRQHHESCISSGPAYLRLETTCYKGFVVLFAYFTASCQ